MTSKKDPIVILFNHGGGMRGLIPARLMDRIEKATGLQISEMVDIFTGPSTGAILNAALNIPRKNNPHKAKYHARHMVRFYEREGIKIFPPDRFREFRGFVHDFNNRTMRIGKLNSLFRQGHYNPAYLSSALHKLYGDSKLSDSLKSLVIPVYNIDGEQLHVVSEAGENEDTPVHTQNNVIDDGGHAVWLKNMQLDTHYTPPPKVLLRDAVLASCAAPTYFPCHHFDVKHHDARGQQEYSGIDGSIFDNPCITYHGAIRQHLPVDRDIIVIILGTGYTLRSIKKEDWNRFGGLGVVDPVNDLPLINILFHAPESALMESFTQELDDSLHIFNKSMVSNNGSENVPSPQIDDASPENLKKLKNFTEEIIEENKQSFDNVCDLLVRNRDKKFEQNMRFWRNMKRRFYFITGIKSH